MTAPLRIHALAAGYGSSQILHGVDLVLSAGERVGLVGLNGHGKTTLLRAIVGIGPWRSGEIELHGRSILHAATHRLASAGLVLIPQGDALFPGMTVRENLDLGAFARAAWRRRRHRRDHVLELFPQLGQRLGQLAGTLSGGERRMLSIGRGLMADADVYLVDEPSLGLGPGVAQGVVRALAALELGEGALLLAEQNRALVEGTVDRTVRVHAGQLLPDTPEAEVFAKDDRGGGVLDDPESAP